MCLKLGTKSQKNLASFRKLHRQKKSVVTCWKVYRPRLQDKCLEQLYYGKSVGYYGIVMSNRDQKELNRTEEEFKAVDYGIHVFTDKIFAVKWHNASTAEIVIPVKCNMRDLVACGINNQAVFSKIVIEKKTWDKTFNEGEK